MTPLQDNRNMNSYLILNDDNNHSHDNNNSLDNKNNIASAKIFLHCILKCDLDGHTMTQLLSCPAFQADLSNY